MEKKTKADAQLCDILQSAEKFNIPDFLLPYEVQPGAQENKHYLLTNTHTNRTFLVRGELTNVYGKSKSGKSAYLRDIAQALANPGQKICNFAKYDGHPLRIAYIDTEQSQYDSGKILQGHNGRIDVFNFSNGIVHPQEETTQEEQRPPLATIFDYILEAMLYYDVVCVDTITEVTADFNDQKATREMFERLKNRMRITNCTIIATIHTNEGTNDTKPIGHWGNQVKRGGHDGLLVQIKNEGGNQYHHQVITHDSAREHEHALPKMYCYIENGKRIYKTEE